MSKKCNIGVAILLGLIIIINVLGLLKKDAALKLETMKLGGPENMKIIEKFYTSPKYISQQTMGIEQALAQINTMNNNENGQIEENNNGDKNLENTDNMIAELEKIKSSSVIHGKSDARFTILEYSELLCSYCKKHSMAGTIESVIEKYPNEVNTIFRNFIVHPEASKLGEVVECVGELKAKSQHEFIKNAFASEGGFSVEALLDIAGNLGVNKAKLQECVDSGRHTQTVNNQTNEGRTLFGVNGTPGNVIVDRETGKFVAIPGAYPVEKFIEEIEKLKNN